MACPPPPGVWRRHSLHGVARLEGAGLGVPRVVYGQAGKLGPGTWWRWRATGGRRRRSAAFVGGGGRPPRQTSAAFLPLPKGYATWTHGMGRGIQLFQCLRRFQLSLDGLLVELGLLRKEMLGRAGTASTLSPG